MLLGMLRAAWLLNWFLLLTSTLYSLLCMQIAQASLYNSHIRVLVPIPRSVSQKIRVWVCSSPRSDHWTHFLTEQINGLYELDVDTFNTLSGDINKLPGFKELITENKHYAIKVLRAMSFIYLPFLCP